MRFDRQSRSCCLSTTVGTALANTKRSTVFSKEKQEKLHLSEALGHYIPQRDKQSLVGTSNSSEQIFEEKKKKTPDTSALSSYFLQVVIAECGLIHHLSLTISVNVEGFG